MPRDPRIVRSSAHKGETKRRRYKRAAPGEQFLLMPEFILVHPVYKRLSDHAKAILVDICRRYNCGSIRLQIRNNNGQIAYGIRAAAKIGIKRDSAAKAMKELIEAGFLDPRDTWSGFGCDGHRRAREFRITFFPTHGHIRTWKNTTRNTRSIMLRSVVLDSMAYRSAPSAEKVVLIEMIRREDGGNNGRINFGGLDYCATIGQNRYTTDRALNGLRGRLLIVETKPANKRRGKARNWRLPMIDADGKAATMDFLLEAEKAALKNILPVRLVHIKTADGPTGAHKPFFSAVPVTPSEPSETTSQRLNYQEPQEDRGIMAHQEQPVASAPVYVHQPDTSRKTISPSAAPGPASAAPPTLQTEGTTQPDGDAARPKRHISISQLLQEKLS